jgi:hypothetical protein
MTIILLALACSSVIPESTSNPVDKLAGHADVRLGQKVEDVAGLVRAPKLDHYEDKEEAYTRPADVPYFSLGSAFITANDVPTYFAQEGIITSVRFLVLDYVWTDQGAAAPDPVLSHYNCRSVVEELTKLLGAAPKQDADSYKWQGDLSTTRVLKTITDDNRNDYFSTHTQYCLYIAQLGKE